jgi:hypothetical protein
VETLWVSEGVVVGTGRTIRENTAVVSPGIRVAFNVPGNLQIVPGLAYSFGVAGSNQDSLLLYLSFEHPFTRQ